MEFLAKSNRSLPQVGTNEIFNLEIAKKLEGWSMKEAMKTRINNALLMGIFNT